MLFVAALELLQSLLAAKRDLALDATRGRLDRYDAVILAVLGYAQKSRQEVGCASPSSPRAAGARSTACIRVEDRRANLGATVHDVDWSP